MMARAAALALATLFTASQAAALEIHSFFDQSCAVESGLLIEVRPATITLVTLDGRTVDLPRETIREAVVHKTLQNPLASIALTPRTRALARKIYLAKGEPAFTGWALQFIEDLVIYFDTAGKVHVLDLYAITEVKPVELPPDERLTLPQASPVHLAFPQGYVACAGAAGHEQGLPPSRVIADPIKVHDHLAKFQAGFERLEGFEERTQLYAMPFLYEERSKLGLTYTSGDNFPVPLYFQWSNGRPYRFQSLTVIGLAPVEWVPNLEPVFALRSDLKSHVFTATLVGNILAPAAGSAYYAGIFGPGIVPQKPRAIELRPHFNYLALMGADWGPWSLSVGPFYPLFYVKVGALLREVPSTRAAPTVRLVYRTPRLTLRALAWDIRYRGNDSNGADSTDGTGDPLAEPAVETAKQFRFRGNGGRLGADFAIRHDIKVGADVALARGKYEEELPALNMLAPVLSYTDVRGVLSVRHEFGYYVTVKGFAILSASWFDTDLPVAAAAKERTGTTFGGTLEFVF